MHDAVACANFQSKISSLVSIYKKIWFYFEETVIGAERVKNDQIGGV